MSAPCLVAVPERDPLGPGALWRTDWTSRSSLPTKPWPGGALGTRNPPLDESDPLLNPPSRHVPTSVQRTRRHPSAVVVRRPCPLAQGRNPERVAPRGLRDLTRGQSPTTSRKVAGRRRSAAQIPPPLPSPWRGGLTPPKLRSTSKHAAHESSSAHPARPKPGRAGGEPKPSSDEPRMESVTARHADRSPKRPAVPGPLTRFGVAVYPVSTGAKQLVVVPDAIPALGVRGGSSVGQPSSTPALRAWSRLCRPRSTSSTRRLSTAEDKPHPSVTSTPRPPATSAFLRHPTRALRGLALSRAARIQPPLGDLRRTVRGKDLGGASHEVRSLSANISTR